MPTVPNSSTIYLSEAPTPISATFHPARAEVSRDTSVLICPAFGWESTCSYRPCREWAIRLAQNGYSTLRVTYPGTGDSGGGPRDPDLLDHWTSAIDTAARWIADVTGCPRTLAIGMQLGAVLAYRATALGAAIDDLVLWASPARGKSVVRQQRAFSKLEAAQFFEGLPQPPPLAEGELEAGGFLLSAETVSTLEALDLTELALPDPASHRVLLLEQDGIAVDKRLRAHLEHSGATLTVAPGPGYAEMTSHPQQSALSPAVADRVIAWLDQTSAPQAAAPAGRLSSSADAGARISTGEGDSVLETAITIEQPFGRLAGILAEPSEPSDHGHCAVLLNAGAVPHTGPSRMWVELARRWAQDGVPTLRLDVQGIGDADGDGSPYREDLAFRDPVLIAQVTAALDFLEERGSGNTFLLVGLCSGAYWAFHVCLADARVSAAFMINLRALSWDRTLAPARDFRALLRSPSWTKIRAEASRERVRAIAAWMLAAPVRGLRRLWTRRRTEGTPPTSQDSDLLRRFAVSGKRAMMLFAVNEPLQEELNRSGELGALERSGILRIEEIAVRDHTLRPIWAQRQAHAALDRALAWELQRTDRDIQVPVRAR